MNPFITIEIGNIGEEVMTRADEYMVSDLQDLEYLKIGYKEMKRDIIEAVYRLSHNSQIVELAGKILTII